MNYYNIDKVKEKAEKEKSNFIFIYGGKSKGKSYQVKDKLMIKDYLQNKKRFVLLRRLTEEVDKTKCELYFRDYLINNDLSAMTNGKFNNIEYISNLIYLVFKQDGKIIRKEHIGYNIALSQEQNWSSILSQKDIGNIVFEEFQSRTTYLKNEIDKLMFFYSTVDREQATTKLWFIGNAISKSCPYWQDLGLLDIIKNQKTGIKKVEYRHEAQSKPFIILIEKTGAFKSNATTIGQASKAISQGDWFSEKQFKTKMKGHVRGLIRFNVDFSGLKFILELNQSDKAKLYWFVWSVEEFNKDDCFLITNKVEPDIKIINNIYEVPFDNLKKIVNATFTKNNIYFSDDITGTDFYKSCHFHIKG